MNLVVSILALLILTFFPMDTEPLGKLFNKRPNGEAKIFEFPNFEPPYP